MQSPRDVPENIDDVWELAREHFSQKQASHLDATLMQIGANAMLTDQVPDDEASRLAYHAYKSAGPEQRHHLAHLFMRTVGHQEFLDDPEA